MAFYWKTESRWAQGLLKPYVCLRTYLDLCWMFSRLMCGLTPVICAVVILTAFIFGFIWIAVLVRWDPKAVKTEECEIEMAVPRDDANWRSMVHQGRPWEDQIGYAT